MKALLCGMLLFWLGWSVMFGWVVCLEFIPCIKGNIWCLMAYGASVIQTSMTK
jgi:hypothetical protein